MFSADETVFVLEVGEIPTRLFNIDLPLNPLRLFFGDFRQYDGQHAVVNLGGNVVL